ncbi:pyruvate kinase [Agromyces rhizosphaerae]|uniref:pyruvate kinase n=1 Tax=Agromyces rhizosphaerae TaxID=88374 RepID=A0A9W6FQF8_9MICO|nr:pyruvate kinase [Agromyces rhizosphaerae]GLI28531.1 pyruvate kinase [Agromyces rhizosphaerae]
MAVLPGRHVRTERLRTLRAEVADLRAAALAAEAAERERIDAVDPVHRGGATNLVHYLALRSRDLRPLQERLSAEGLSSLGRMEAGVLRNLDAVLRMLGDALGEPDDALGDGDAHEARLSANAAALLGGLPEDRTTRIMVTLPSTAAHDPAEVAGFAEAGMDLARVNCAHDGPAAWARMAANVRAAGAGIPVAMDLAGPKLRTGPIAAGPRVIRIKPERDQLGRVLAPARVRLVAPGAPAGHAGTPEVPVTDAGWLRRRAPGDSVRFTDTRGRSRRLHVEERDGNSVVLRGDRTSYLATGMVLAVEDARTSVGVLPAVVQAHRVHPGDTITLTADLTPAEPTSGDRHRVGCTLPEAFATLRPGHRVAFDDGAIAGVVREVGERSAEVEVTRAAPGGTKLRAEKGINLPDTDLPVSALTAEDRAALDSVVEFADIVQLSFVRSEADVRELADELDARGAGDLGVVVKIETTQGFADLPDIFLELMRRPKGGVMIARGDLGVEAGFERLAELQEEMLWLCEAARVPVIWATEVLDTLADTGVPTRAEVTDAAAGDRAECVMLNKGPYIPEAIRTLDDIFSRMHGHLDKKRPLLRRLRSFQRED